MKPTGKQGILRALASCRRVFLLLVLGITLLAAGLYSQAPGLNELRPHLESYLKKQLHLQQLKLGSLSWYWAGYLWLESEQLDFVSEHETAAFHDGGMAVRISLLSLLGGRLAPEQILLKRGTLELNIRPDVPGGTISLQRLRLDEVDLLWRYGERSGKLPALRLVMDSDLRSLHADNRSLSLDARLDEDGLPRMIKLQCRHTDWLPKPWRDYISNRPSLRIALQRSGSRQWQISAGLQSGAPSILMPGTLYSLPLNELQAELTLNGKANQPLSPESIRIERASWRLGADHIELHGLWENGLLDVQASSEHLPLPLVWSGLRPLGGAAWHQWLQRMKRGAASATTASLRLPWPDPLHEAPVADTGMGFAFRVKTHISGADIALGNSPDTLEQTIADIDIDEKGLNARIDDARLPHMLGRSSGTLHIPWATLELQIRGHAQVQARHLLAWRGPDISRNWHWIQDATDASFVIDWLVHESQPRRAHATLQPPDQWKLDIGGIPVSLGGGILYWDRNTGIELRQMQFTGRRMQGTLSARATNDSGDWRLASLDAQGEGDLTTLASHFQIPIAHAKGLLSASLLYDGQWSGRLDLTKCSWDHLLGSGKKIGEPFALLYNGRLSWQDDRPTLELLQLKSTGKALQASGSATLHASGLSIRFRQLKTPAFDGSLSISAPLARQPWNIEVQARYMNREALPHSLEHAVSNEDKPWRLSARIARFDWAEARMSGVHVRLDSRPDSIGMFEASQIHTAQLDILDANAMFSMPGHGEIDLRRLQASVEKQRLSMSAHLIPEAGGGMRWRGFATISGDFGHLMRRGGLSEKFRAGTGHVLFSGQGIVLREQPWWQGMDGRLRLRVDDGRILEGGTLTTFLSAISLADLPRLLIGKRKDLTGPGILYERLQMEAIMSDQHIRIRNLAMRSSAFDLAGHGDMDIDRDRIDLYLIVRPLQNLDALLAKIPLLRDILGGSSHSFMRKVYHMHGPFTHARVEPVTPEQAGLAAPGLVERLFSLPERWFGKSAANDKRP